MLGAMNHSLSKLQFSMGILNLAVERRYMYDWYRVQVARLVSSRSLLFIRVSSCLFLPFSFGVAVGGSPSASRHGALDWGAGARVFCLRAELEIPMITSGLSTLKASVRRKSLQRRTAQTLRVFFRTRMPSLLELKVNRSPREFGLVGIGQDERSRLIAMLPHGGGRARDLLDSLIELFYRMMAEPIPGLQSIHLDFLRLKARLGRVLDEPEDQHDPTGQISTKHRREEKRDAFRNCVAMHELDVKAPMLRGVMCSLMVLCVLAGEFALLFVTGQALLTTQGVDDSINNLQAYSFATMTLLTLECLSCLGLARIWHRLGSEGSRELDASLSLSSGMKLWEFLKVLGRCLVERAARGVSSLIHADALFFMAQLHVARWIMSIRRECVDSDMEAIFIEVGTIGLCIVSLIGHVAMERAAAHFRVARAKSGSLGDERRQLADLEDEIKRCERRDEEAKPIRLGLAMLHRRFETAKWKAYARLRLDREFDAVIRHVAHCMVCTDTTGPEWVQKEA